MKTLTKSSAVLMALVLCIGIVLAGCASGTNQGSQASNNSSSKSDTSGSSGSSSKSDSGSASSGSTTAPAAKKVTLDFWSFWGSATRRPVIQHIVDAFNKSQDKITVKYTYLPWGTIWTKNLAAIAAGDPPDVIINDINSVPERAVKNQTMDIAKFVKADKEDIKARFFPQLWNTVLYKGDPYALPFNTDTRILFYNKKMFKDAGLDPNKPPQTWDELYQDALKLDIKKNGKYQRIGYYPLWGNWGTNNWLLNADHGNSYFTDGKPTIDTPRKVAALKWINKWTDHYGQKTVNEFKAAFGSKQADPFISGKVAMMITTATFYTQIRDYGNGMDFGVAPVPAYKQGEGHWSWGGGFVAEIPKGAKHPEASYEFLKYLTGYDAQSYWAIKNYDNIANIKASGAPELKNEMVYQAAVKNMKWTKMTPQPIEAPNFMSLVNPQLDAALLGKITPEKALAKAQKDVENLIKQNAGN